MPSPKPICSASGCTKDYYNGAAEIVFKRTVLFHKKEQQSMSAVIKSPGQLRMMCYKAEVVMSIEAWYFLHGTTNGACNLFYFLSLLSKMQTTDAQLGKRGQTYTAKAGQADGALLGLSREWHIGRKAVRRLLDDFAERDIISVESNPLTSLISLVCVKSWVIDGRLVESPMFRSAVGKFEGVRIHLLNGQQFGTLRRSSRRSERKAVGKGGAGVTSTPDNGTDTQSTASHQSDSMPVLRSKDLQADSDIVGAVSSLGGTIQPSADGTTSDDADTALL